ncbi:wiskott-Aldrich syndrome protein homolog 1-like [Gigantopelta aegis]|uniref:wiskott-Aldrich syndrome protein homolog 1-like n=1 Tax=Gigantopelta aegis TaxID=1735272 RepID=UPI001B88832F|nr:wiskott-Aldrich syndrome protein homolog 1-like [Gigantopelta aegis]
MIKYRVEHNGDSATITLIYGVDRKRRSPSRRRRRRPKTTQGGGGEANLTAQPPGAAPPVPKRRTRPTGAVQGDPNPVAKPPGAVHSTRPPPPTRQKHSPGAAQGGPKLSAPLTLAAPPVDVPAQMDTGHVVITDPPASPPAPPAVVAVPAAVQREPKRRKMSAATIPKTSDWILVCDKLPAKYRGAVIGDRQQAPQGTVGRRAVAPTSNWTGEVPATGSPPLKTTLRDSTAGRTVQAGTPDAIDVQRDDSSHPKDGIAGHPSRSHRQKRPAVD